MSDTKKKQDIPNLPIWLTIPIGFVVALILGEHYGAPWWLRSIAVIAVSLVIEAVNQAVRRMASRGKDGVDGVEPSDEG
ncbi:hypothetical protein FCH28_13255 [Streptomyces piniterrae]|uniref:Uncharacterized protein n=1 Tax=Streptomyces piniterrae TaxID=2571125 RepID=A0A4U0NK58_9ACTN|nr:hypothetical protein [Streptomyces piniterrae]TJZ54152.1 hypothetical protein FCH28_13255 [Streptomyces piniterrae]